MDQIQHDNTGARKAANDEAYLILASTSKKRGWRPRRHRPQAGRGRPEKYDEDAVIAIYVELEAHRRRRNVSLSRLLAATDLRETSEGHRVRLLITRQRTLRRLHSEGQREAELWRSTLFIHRPHPRATAIIRKIESRIEVLHALEQSGQTQELLTLNFR